MRLVCQTPGDHAGMILVPRDHLLEILTAKSRPPLQTILPEKQSHSGCFIDHKKTKLVSQIEHLLRIRIMGGAEGIGTHPLHQGIILDDQCRQIPPPGLLIGVGIKKSSEVEVRIWFADKIQLQQRSEIFIP